jgi:DNA-binding MarR family transcriptional regulator
MASPARQRDTAPLAKILPHNPDAERSILGGILVAGLNDATRAAHAVAEAAETIHSGDFFDARHERLFRRLVGMVAAAKPIDTITVFDELQSSGELEETGGAVYLSSLTDGMPAATNIAYYAQIVLKKSRLRQAIHAAEKIQTLAFDDKANPEDILSGLSDTVKNLTPTAGKPKIGANGHVAYSYLEFMAAQFPMREQLVEVSNDKGESIGGLIPAGGTVIVFSMPHHLKSYFTTALALACTTAGKKLGRLLVKKPIRTLLVQMEDPPGELKDRIQKLTDPNDFDSSNFYVIPRWDHNGNRIEVQLPNDACVKWLLGEIEHFKADLVILDVVRRVTAIDLNSPKDSSSFLEAVDRLREASTNPAIMLVHHENRREADIMYATAGSYNLPGWANVMIQFKRKQDHPGFVTSVEMEVDHKLAQNPEPMRLLLDLKSETPVRLENLEENAGLQELRDALDTVWTVRNMAEAMGVHPASAKRRLAKFIAAGVVEKVRSGKKGRGGGLASFRFIGEGE